jgi:Rrf2 family protein
LNLSRTADHALRAVLYLAQQTPDRLVPSHEIAASLGAPANYMAKTLGALARADILEGVRGAVGGFRLRRSATEISVADVLHAVDEPRPRRVCLLGDRPCEPDDPCLVHARWTCLREEAERPYRETAVAELLEETDTHAD